MHLFPAKMKITLKETWSSFILSIVAFVFICLDFQLYSTIQHESYKNISITVKAVMLDHVNSYMLQPLSELLVETTRFPYIFPSITANHISYLGLISALIAARLVLSDQLWIRRVAVFTFFVRQFLDDLDGFVARFHMGIDAKKQVSVPSSSGYLVDGACDGLGYVVFWLAVFTWCLRREQNKLNVLKSNTTYTLLQSAHTPNHHRRRIIKYYLLLLTQMGFSSFLWNLFLIQYHQVLDPSLDAGFQTRTPLQEEIFKSSLMFMIMWLWRCLNPHALTNYFLVSIWLNRATHYAKRSSQYIFWIILGLSFLCMVHLKDIKYRLDPTFFNYN